MLNRAKVRAEIFVDSGDHAAFERILRKAPESAFRPPGQRHAAGGA